MTAYNANGVKIDEHHRRDGEQIITYFGNVTNFVCPTDFIRMCEVGKGNKVYFVDYHTEKMKPTGNWNTNVSVVYTANECTTYAHGKPIWTGETNYLKQLYQRIKIDTTTYPSKYTDYRPEYLWLSERHKEYHKECYAMDVDAWSTTSDGRPIIWDMKFHLARNWTWFEDHAIKLLGKQNIPVFKIKYAVAHGSWVRPDDTAHYVTIIPANKAARDLMPDTKDKISYEEAITIMNNIVAGYELF